MNIEERKAPKPLDDVSRAPQNTEPVVPKLRPATIEDYDRWLAGYLKTSSRIGLESKVHGEQSYTERMTNYGIFVAESDFNTGRREQLGTTIIIVPKGVAFTGDRKQFAPLARFTLLIEGYDEGGNHRDYEIIGDSTSIDIFNELPSCKEIFARLRADNFGHKPGFETSEFTPR